ncbi:hypothetical protein V6N13_095544 [Hibiscus sabdariffa]
MISISVAQSAGRNTCNTILRGGTFLLVQALKCLILDGRMTFMLQMMLRRELEEQIVVQQAIELQRRRLISLQLPDFKNDGVHHHQRGLSVSLSADSHAGGNVDPSDSSKQEVSEASVPSIMNAVELEEVKSTCVQKFGVGNSQEYQGKANEQ